MVSLLDRLFSNPHHSQVSLADEVQLSREPQSLLYNTRIGDLLFVSDRVWGSTPYGILCSRIELVNFFRPV